MNIYPKSTKEEEKAPEDSPKQQPRQIENDWNTISPGPNARVSPSAEEHVASKTPAVEEAEEEEEEKEEKEQTFPQLLMDMVEQETEDGAMIDGARVLEWLESGTSFVIRDKKAFEKKVLPKYFHAKCKFVSFARKLHRWGFRQAQSRSRRNSAMGFIFIHTNFVRGDKNRCLKMRSIVKKPNQQQAVVVQPQQPFSGFAGGGQHFAGHNSLFQGLAGMNSQYGNMNPSAFLGMAAQSASQFPQAPSPMMYSSFNQGQGQGGATSDNNNSLRNMNNNSNSSLGLGGQQSSLFSPNNQLPQGANNNALGLTSTEMFQAGLRLERMEQSRNQQASLMGMLNNMGNAANAAPSPSAASSSFNMPQSQPQHQHQSAVSSFNSSSNNNSANNPNNNSVTSLSGNSSSSLGGGNSNNAMTEVELASEIMKRNQGMEPWQALELAKRLQQG